METTTQPKVAIIILNWNGITDTITLLKNLESVEYVNFSVLVVDNASTDDSVGQIARYMEQLRRSDKPALKLSLLPLSKNFGYAEGNNKGIVQASREKPDYYLLLNNDTLVDPHFLSRLVEAAESEPSVAAAAPIIYYADPNGAKSNRVWFAGGWLNFYAGGAHHHTAIPSLEKDRSWVPTQFLTGCCLLIKRGRVEQSAHLFDPTFFAYGEDVDLSIRLQRQGYQLALVPKATIWHKLASSSGGAKSFNFWYYNIRNNWLIMRRYARWYHWPVFILYFLFYKPVLLSVGGAILKPRRDKWFRLQAITLGTFDAIRGAFGKRK